MRTVEYMLGIPVPGYKPFQASPNANFTFTMAQAASEIIIPEVQNAINQAMPILLQIALELKIDVMLDPAMFWASSTIRAKADPLSSKHVFLGLRGNLRLTSGVALWISIGSIITLPIRRTLRLALRYMTTICTTRGFSFALGLYVCADFL